MLAAHMEIPTAIEKEKQRLHKCISRESNPGHIDGNDVFYHKTTDASDQEFSGRNSIRASRIWRRSSADPQKQWISHYKGFQSNGVSLNKALPLKVICFFWGLSFYSNSFRITGFPFREYFPPYGLLQGIVPDDGLRAPIRDSHNCVSSFRACQYSWIGPG